MASLKPRTGLWRTAARSFATRWPLEHSTNPARDLKDALKCPDPRNFPAITDPKRFGELLLRMDPVAFTSVALADWALKALSNSACVLSDGLKCFAATIVQAASHTPYGVGSGRQSAQRAEFRCVNPDQQSEDRNLGHVSIVQVRQVRPSFPR